MPSCSPQIDNSQVATLPWYVRATVMAAPLLWLPARDLLGDLAPAPGRSESGGLFMQEGFE